MKKCSKCDEEFDNNNDKKKHERAMHPQLIECNLCGQVLKSERNLKAHQSKKIPCNLKCRHCGYDAKNVKTYTYHMQKKHEQLTKRDRDLHEDELHDQPKRKTIIPTVYQQVNIVNNNIQMKDCKIDFNLLNLHTPAAIDTTSKMMLYLGRNDATVLDQSDDMKNFGLKVIENVCVDESVPSNSIFQLQDHEYTTKIKDRNGWKYRTFEETHDMLQTLIKELMHTFMDNGINSLKQCIYGIGRNQVPCLVYDITNTSVRLDAILIYRGKYRDEYGKVDEQSAIEIRTKYKTKNDIIQCVVDNAAVKTFRDMVIKRRDEVIESIFKMVISPEDMKDMLDKTKQTCENNYFVAEIDTKAEPEKTFDLSNMLEDEKKALCLKYLHNYDDRNECTVAHITDQRNFLISAMRDAYCQKVILESSALDKCVSVRQHPTHFVQAPIIQLLN